MKEPARTASASSPFSKLRHHDAVSQLASSRGPRMRGPETVAFLVWKYIAAGGLQSIGATGEDGGSDNGPLPFRALRGAWDVDLC